MQNKSNAATNSTAGLTSHTCHTRHEELNEINRVSCCMRWKMARADTTPGHCVGVTHMQLHQPHVLHDVQCLQSQHSTTCYQRSLQESQQGGGDTVCVIADTQASRDM
jgi:hypothetical protein